MSEMTWDTRLDEATTEGAVVALCDRFLAGWTFQDLGRLPATCQPRRVIEANDISPYAVELSGRLDERDAGTAPMLHRMSTFFTKAQLRMAQIAQAQTAPPDGQDPAGSVPYPYR
jgi:hypothetical protein